MAHQPEIWTGDIRRVLYKRLVQLFGPQMNGKRQPHRDADLTQIFDRFCGVFAQAVGAKSGDAVKHQIRFAMPETEHGSTWGRQAQTAILNKAAALEAGFIRDGQLPNIVAVGRNDRQAGA